MSVFEDLKPFVSLCQACGLIPYTIKNRASTTKFEKFTFSFRQFTTFWFLLIFILQFVTIGKIVYFSMNRLVDLSSDASVPLTVTVVFGVNWVSAMAQLLGSRWITLHYRQLRKAVEAIQEVEKLLGDKLITQRKSNVTKRLIFGSVIVVLTAAGTSFVFIPVYRSILPTDIRILAVTAIFTTGTLATVMIECIFLMAYLCYYIISHYIHLLLEPETHEDVPMMSQKETERQRKKLEHSALIFNHLCRASSELNSIFSLPTLFILTLKFISVVSAAYVYVYSCLRPHAALEDYSVSIPSIFLTDWVRIFIVLYAADMPVNQVRLLRERVIRMSYSGLAQTMTDKIDAMTMLMHISEDRVRFSAAGLFTVGMHLIPALTGAVVTYMVILLQS